MTYVLAWVDKVKGAAYVVADSVTTFEHESGKNPFHNRGFKTTTFLESHIYSQDVTVVESSLKITRINSKTVLAYAGNLVSLREIRDHLALLVRLKPNIPVKDLLQQCLDQGDYQDIQLVIAVMHDDFPKLVTYNSDGRRQIYDHESIAHLGSLVDKRLDIANQFLRMVARLVTSKIDIPKEYVLTYMMTFMQTFSLHHVLIEANVGGIISGIELNKDDAHWPGDRSFLLYDGQNSKMLKLFKILYRYDALGVVTAFPEAQFEMVIADGIEDYDALMTAMGGGQKMYLHGYLETNSISLMSVSDQRAVIIPREVNKREGLVELTIEPNDKGVKTMQLISKRIGISDFIEEPLEINKVLIAFCRRECIYRVIL